MGGGVFACTFHFPCSHMTEDISLIPKANCPSVWEPVPFPLFHHGTTKHTRGLIRNWAIKPSPAIVFGETSGSLLVVASLLRFSEVINMSVFGLDGAPLGNLTKLTSVFWGHGSVHLKDFVVMAKFSHLRAQCEIHESVMHTGLEKRTWCATWNVNCF